MALKINVKPLKGDQFEVEVQPEAKVSDLKKTIEAARADFPADGQKLIHVGKILKDDDTVESLGIKPTEFLVVMITKAKPPAPKAAPAGTAAAPSAPAPATPAATPAAPGAGETAPAAQGGDAAGQAAATVVTGAGMEAAVVQLMDMGFPREQVEQCLTAAFGNPDRAVEFLMNGIPDSIMREAGGGGGGGADAAPPAAAAGGGGGGAAPPTAGGGMPGAVPIPPELAAFRDNPQFTQLAGVIAQNPQIIAQLLPALQASHPEVAQAITQNPQAFLQMVAETASGGGGGGDPVSAMLAAAGGGGGGGGAPPGQTVIRLTEDERAAVERLASLGFDPQMAVQAYLACDKNEELAANFLFDSAGDDMQD